MLELNATTESKSILLAQFSICLWRRGDQNIPSVMDWPFTSDQAPRQRRCRPETGSMQYSLQLEERNRRVSMDVGSSFRQPSQTSALRERNLSRWWDRMRSPRLGGCGTRCVNSRMRFRLLIDWRPSLILRKDCDCRIGQPFCSRSSALH